MPDTAPSWGIRISEYQQPRDADAPEWAFLSQRRIWRRRGLVVWDCTAQQIAHLFASNTDPKAHDTDGDGAADGLEVALGTDPNNCFSTVQRVFLPLVLLAD